MERIIKVLKICVLIYTTYLLYVNILHTGRLYMVDIYIKLPYIVGVYTILIMIEFTRKEMIR